MSAAGLQSSHVPGAGALTPNAILNSSKQTSYYGSEVPHESKGNQMEHPRKRISGKSPAQDTRNIPAFSITQGDWLKLVSAAMHEDTGNRPDKAKFLAAKLECSWKTTKSWLDGDTAPSGILDLRAMNRIPAYEALKREIAALERNLDPRLQAKYQELHRLTLELAGG